MKTAVSIVMLLWAAGVALTEPPPAEADLEQWLRREPLDKASWPRWAARLREWSAESFEQARPAFRAGYQFVKPDKGLQKRLAVPKQLTKDAVAWMLLAGAYLEEAPASKGPASIGAAAADAARRSVRLDSRLARAHFFLCRGVILQQLTPAAEGGPARPDVGRLREALKALQQARALAPAVRWLSPADAGRLAVHAREWADAERFLGEAAEESPADRELARLLARAIQERGEAGSAARLASLAPRFPDDGVLAARLAYALARADRPGEAAEQLARARRLGTDPAGVLDPRWVKQFEQERSRSAAETERRRAGEEKRRAEKESADRFLHGLGVGALAFVGFYGVVVGLMCLLGWRLAPRIHPEAQLGRIYLAALLVGLVLFYVALPVLFAGMLVIFLPLLGLAILSSGRGSDGGAASFDLLRTSGGGLKAVLKAMFARAGTGVFGVRKRKEECPGLFAGVEAVARSVGTEPPDEVWLAPGADFWVRQEGRGPFGLFGARKRVLTLGLCVFHFLSVSELRAILAHEFAHFSHDDTFWHRFLYQVTLSLRTAEREMARTGGWLTWCNPFYWFFWAYSRSYNLLGAGFSRWQEYRADRVACAAEGSDVFVEALRKVCTEGGHFEHIIEENVNRLLRNDQAFINMYLAFRRHREAGVSLTRERLERFLTEQRPSLYASHPTFGERAEAARSLPAAAHKDDLSALALFERPEEIERELTDYFTRAVARA